MNIRPVHRLNVRQRPGAPRRGMAMALVLFVVAIAVTLGVCFLNTSVAATPLSQRFANRIRARYIAESGVAQMVSYLQRDTNWRTARAQGVWITEHPLAGGWFWVAAIDPVDGDFANNNSDPVRLTVTGEFGGARYRAAATFTPASTGRISAATRVETKGDAAIDSYNFAAGPYGPANRGAAAVLTCNAVGSPNIVLQNSAVIAGSLYFPAQADPALAMSVATSAQITGVLGNVATDQVPLTEIIEPAYTPSTSNVVYDSNDVVTLTSDFACNHLTIKDGAVVKVVGDVTIHVDGDLSIANDADIRPDNPRYGNTTTLNQGQTNMAFKQIATQVSVTDTVALRTVAAYTKKKGKHVRFAVYQDSAGEPGALIVQSAIDTLTSDSMYWHETYMPAATLVPGTYWIALSFDDNAEQYQYGGAGETRVRNYNAITNGFPPAWGGTDQSHKYGVNLYLTGNVAGKGGKLTVYSRNGFEVRDHANVNVYTGDPSRMVFYHADESPTAEARFQGESVTYATVVVPYAMTHLREKAELSGVLQTEYLKMEGDSRLRVDTSGGLAKPGLLVDLSILLKDRSRIDGLTGDAHVVSNAVGNPVIWIRERSKVSGDGYGGPGGAGGNVDVQVAKTAVLTGSRGNLTTAVAMDLPTPPAGLPIISDFNRDKQTTRISSSFQCKNFNIKGTAVIEVEGHVKVVATGDVNFADNCKVVLLSGASLELHFKQNLTTGKLASVNVGGDPSRLRLYYGGIKAEIKEKVSICATVTAPLCNLKIKDDAQWFGSIRADILRMENRAQIHQDASGAGGLQWSE